MEGQTYTEEIDCGSFFDQIDDFIEFPQVTDTTLNSIDCNDFTDIWTNNSDELQVSDPIFSDTNAASTLSAELSVPYEDIIQLEWLSNFVEDSFSGGGMTMNKENIPVKNEPVAVAVANYHFQMSSPVSVLESSSSSSSSSSCSGSGTGGMMIPLSPTQRGPQRARSKRSRPATFNPRAAIELLSPPNLIPIPGSMESVIPVEKKRKKKPKKKPEVAAAAQFNPEDNNGNGIENETQTGMVTVTVTGQGVRKCMHCEITKTPQWRAGPMGPKTLCNACGVRYKSGRLFPEYRPAASPTFVPSVHSNSHKKVVEMRTKCMPIEALGSVLVPPELICNPNPLPEYM